jgi:hypothetical protein
VSVGRRFADWLKHCHPTISSDYELYLHWTPAGEFEARQYPNALLPLYLDFVDTVWIPKHAADYFNSRDPAALPFVAHLLLHDFFGNTRANARSTYVSLRTIGESTCNNLLNRSAYWIAAMIHPSGKVVRPDLISVYYKRSPQTSKYCKPPFATACLPLPRGLRYVFGYDLIGGRHDPATMRWWNCDGPGAGSGKFATIRQAAAGCPKGARIGGAIISPNCWNGRDLDSPDHRSHMAFQEWPPELGQPRCPATHPYLVPFFEAIPWLHQRRDRGRMEAVVRHPARQGGRHDAPRRLVRRMGGHHPGALDPELHRRGQELHRWRPGRR